MSAKIKVPDGMLKAACDPIVIPGSESWSDARVLYAIELLTKALSYQREHPPVPSEQQLGQMSFAGCVALNGNWNGKKLCAEWVRRMYDAPEPEVPEAVKDLLPFPKDVVILDQGLYRRIKAHLDDVATEAYRRGRESKCH